MVPFDVMLGVVVIVSVLVLAVLSRQLDAPMPGVRTRIKG